MAALIRPTVGLRRIHSGHRAPSSKEGPRTEVCFAELAASGLFSQTFAAPESHILFSPAHDIQEILQLKDFRPESDIVRKIGLLLHRSDSS